MKTEQFIYGLFNHYGTKLIRSPGISNLLTSEIVDYLCKIERTGIHQNLWPNGVITVTNVHDANDEYGRKGVWNHTFAFRLLDYLAEVQPSKLPFSWLLDLKEPISLQSLDVKL